MAGDAQVVKMPKLGESVTEGTLVEWKKAVGDTVEIDEALFEVSTDKVDSEIPSAFEGVLTEILVPEGTTVPVGAELARIGPVGSAAAPAEAEAATTPAAVPQTVQEGQANAFGPPTIEAAAPAPPAAPADGDGIGALSPVVRRLAAEHGIDLSTLQGSGAGGRIRREDVLAVINARGTTATQAAPTEAAPAAVPAAPAAPAAAPPAAAEAPPPAPGTEVVPLSKIRLATAKHMIASRRTSAHVWTSIEVDLEQVEQVRQRHKNRFRKEEGVGLTYLAFIALAVCDGLRAYPALNSSIDVDAGTQTFHHYINLGIAVDVEGQGLMAPVIKDAGGLNLRGMARAIRAVADKVRAGKATPDDLTGSTFTISNPGPLGTYASAAIINQPNVGILTTEGVARRPTVVGDAIAIHHMSILGLSYDHRALDGVVAGQFLAHIRQRIEQHDWEAEL